MITYAFICFVAFSTVVALNSWRSGLFMMLVVGMLQDPVRKLTPGIPALFVLSTLPVWCAISIRMFSTEKELITRFSMIYLKLVSRIRMFVIILIPGSGVMLMKGLFLWKVVLLSAFGYVSPVFAIIVGFVFSQNNQLLLRFLTFYCFVVAIMLSGTVMEYMNVFSGWNAIGTSAMKMVWIKYVSYGHTIYMKAGFFRSPDIMGWHAAVMSMISLTLFFINHLKTFRWIWLVFAVWGVLCIVICGRYKMIAMPMLWVVSFSLLIFLFRGVGRLIGVAVIGIIVLVGMNMAGSKVGLGGTDFMLYAKSPVSYSVERVDKHGVGAVITTFRQSGFWGNGLGSATQGARYAGIRLKQGWQEGGLSKIMGELGVLGIVVFFLLVLSLITAMLSTIKRESHNDSVFILRASLLSIIVANAAAFVVSAQIYSDLFVLSIISLCIGAVLARGSMDRMKA